jgi:hypothetical protein
LPRYSAALPPPKLSSRIYSARENGQTQQPEKSIAQFRRVTSDGFTAQTPCWIERWLRSQAMQPSFTTKGIRYSGKPELFPESPTLTAVISLS